MIQIGIVGYGNLGKGVEQALKKQPDMALFGVFTQRDVDTVQTISSTVYHFDQLKDFKQDIDVLILCGSSEKDLRSHSATLIEDFALVDSFDMHALIPEHVRTIDLLAKKNKKTALVSVGWDPGIFSLQKTILDAILPDGETQSFWGNGISQGHSDVASRIEGVKLARSYAIPNENNISKFKNHQTIDTNTNQHKICYVVANEGASLAEIEKNILDIPHYFRNSSTEIKFISELEMNQNHTHWNQGGRIIRRAKTSVENKHSAEFSLTLDSNPEFTASILVAYARATYKMQQRQEYGAFTALDIRSSDLSSKSRDQLIIEML